MLDLSVPSTESRDHATGSLESIVENLVKNWEVEASFKTDLAEWRTIDHENYTFAMNGGAYVLDFLFNFICPIPLPISSRRPASVLAHNH